MNISNEVNQAISESTYIGSGLQHQELAKRLEKLAKDYAREEVKDALTQVRLIIPRTAGVPVTDPTMKSCNQAHEWIEQQLSSLDT